jgi:hypothetical protein
MVPVKVIGGLAGLVVLVSVLALGVRRATDPLEQIGHPDDGDVFDEMVWVRIPLERSGVTADER